MKTTKKLGTIVAAIAIVMCTSISVLAASAWDDINDTLPSNQGDTEVSTVGRADPVNDHFNVIIDSITDGYTAVRAWTEKPIGGNYSNPYFQIDVNDPGYMWNVYYSTLPALGANVVLNLDNPVSTTVTPTVKGKWTPN